MATTTDYRATGSQAKWLPTGVIARAVTITPTAAGLNDVWKVLDVPAGATIVGIKLDAADLDSNASPTITLDVGDATSAQRFIAASTAAQAGGIVTESVVGCLGYNYTAQTTIQIKVHAAAATFQSGNVTLVVSYTIDP